MGKFIEDASYRPSIHSRVILLHPKQDLRGSVPESDDFVGVLSQRIGIDPSQSEVS